MLDKEEPAQQHLEIFLREEYKIQKFIAITDPQS